MSNPSSLPRFQFSLRWLLIFITAASILLFLWVTFGRLAVGMFSLSVRCLIPTAIVVCAIFGRGELRVFAIGAVVPCIHPLLMTQPLSLSLTGMVVSTISQLTASILCGGVAIAVYRWIERRGGGTGNYPS